MVRTQPRLQPVVYTEPRLRVLRGFPRSVSDPRPLCRRQGGFWRLKGDPRPDAAARPGGGRGVLSQRALAPALPGAGTPGPGVSADFVQGPCESPEPR